MATARRARGSAEKTAPRTPSGAASRPYRQARRDRGADTREQLVQAALEVFGRLGFEGASTREIAKTAGANLAAIVYHFGGKEGLHLAVAEYIVERINGLVGPALAGMAAPEATASPEGARRALFAVVSTMIDVLLGEADAERWARFIVREQMQPTAAFDVIYSFLGTAHGLASRLVATILDRPEDEEVRMLVFTLLGQILVFRVAQTMVLRRMAWRGVGAAEREKIKRMVTHNIETILEGARS
jgi:AcrR family transcriptional regulator